MQRVTRHEGTGDVLINAGAVVPGREGACLTCGRMFDCCCEEGVEEAKGSLDRIKEIMGIEDALDKTTKGTPLTWQALRRLQEEVRR